MDTLNIKGVVVTPLKKIKHPKGDILHGIKKSDISYMGFGEAYFSTINSHDIKGWNKHNKMTLNLIVPFGCVKFVIYDDRKKTSSNTRFDEVILSSQNYCRLTIPPKLWIAFEGKSLKSSLILNIANIEHDLEEIEKLEINKIPYKWEN